MSGTYTRIILIQDMGFFQGTSQDPSVHRKLLKYFDAINVELKNPPKRGTQYFGTNAIIR